MNQHTQMAMTTRNLSTEASEDTVIQFFNSEWIVFDYRSAADLDLLEYVPEGSYFLALVGESPDDSTIVPIYCSKEGRFYPNYYDESAPYDFWATVAAINMPCGPSHEFMEMAYELPRKIRFINKGELVLEANVTPAIYHRVSSGQSPFKITANGIELVSEMSEGCYIGAGGTSIRPRHIEIHVLSYEEAEQKTRSENEKWALSQQKGAATKMRNKRKREIEKQILREGIVFNKQLCNSIMEELQPALNEDELEEIRKYIDNIITTRFPQRLVSLLLKGAANVDIHETAEIANQEFANYFKKKILGIMHSHAIQAIDARFN